MESKKCKRFDSCGAQLCPLDESIQSRIWYPEDEICRLREYSKLDWIRNQKKIAKKVRNKYFYFTHEMLCRNCVITVATEGLNPDKTDFKDERAVRRWLKQHPEKRKISEQEREKLQAKMKNIRLGLNHQKKDANRLENSD